MWELILVCVGVVEQGRKVWMANKYKELLFKFLIGWLWLFDWLIEWFFITTTTTTTTTTTNNNNNNIIIIIIIIGYACNLTWQALADCRTQMTLWLTE